jgi:hypothetical protein
MPTKNHRKTCSPECLKIRLQQVKDNFKRINPEVSLPKEVSMSRIKFDYDRADRAAITREIDDIVGGL